MTTFGLSFKNGKEIIAKKSARSLEAAYGYFSKLKNMPLADFKRIFIVIKL